TVGLAPDLPVEVAEVVPADVLAVLDELDGVPEERALVHAGDEPLDDVLGPQVEPGGAGHDLGGEEAAGGVEVSGRGRDSLAITGLAATRVFERSAEALPRSARKLALRLNKTLSRREDLLEPLVLGQFALTAGRLLDELVDDHVGGHALGGGGEVREDAVP